MKTKQKNQIPVKPNSWTEKEELVGIERALIKFHSPNIQIENVKSK